MKKVPDRLRAGCDERRPRPFPPEPVPSDRLPLDDEDEVIGLVTGMMDVNFFLCVDGDEPISQTMDGKVLLFLLITNGRKWQSPGREEEEELSGCVESCFRLRRGLRHE